MTAEAIAEQVFRITVRIFNQTALNQAADQPQCGFAPRIGLNPYDSGLSEGDFVSSLDPPEALRDAVDGCQNIGAWPVDGGRGGALQSPCSPIILYDYPEDRS